MTTDLARTKLESSLAKGSLSALVKEATQRSLLLADVSESMNDRIRTGERRIDALRKVVATLRETHPVPVAAFGLKDYSYNGTVVRLVDAIPEPQGMTPIHKAIDFAKAEGATHIVLVTDGEPDSESLAFEAARNFGGVIDTFFIGNPGGVGARFCQRLAALTGGTSNISDLAKPKELTTKIAGLLPAAPGLLPEAKEPVLL